MSSAAVRPKVVGTAGRPVGHGERRNDVRTTAEPARAGTAIEAEVSAAYDQHGKALLRFALDKTGGDRQLAEEVVQETMVRFWRSAGEVDSIRTLRPFPSSMRLTFARRGSPPGYFERTLSRNRRLIS